MSEKADIKLIYGQTPMSENLMCKPAPSFLIFFYFYKSNFISLNRLHSLFIYHNLFLLFLYIFYNLFNFLHYLLDTFAPPRVIHLTSDVLFL